MRICPREPLVAIAVRGPHHQVVVGVRGIVRPQVARADGHGPARQRGLRDAVGAIEQPDDAVGPGWSGTVTLALARGIDHAATADTAGKAPPAKAEPPPADDEIIAPRQHQSRCPDFLALVAR